MPFAYLYQFTYSSLYKYTKNCLLCIYILIGHSKGLSNSIDPHCKHIMLQQIHQISCLAYWFYYQIANTKQMQPSTPPTVKQTQEQSPPVPNILRSRHKIPLPQDDPLRRIREFVHLPQEIIIDARKYNQQHPSHRDRNTHQDGIRGQIDACLNAVAKVYDQQHKRKGGKTIVNQGKIDKSEPAISANSIHRVDAHLILKYIGTVSQDYGIPNRFNHNRISIISNPPTQNIQPNPKNTEERFTSAQKIRGRSRKSFLHMTLSTNRQKRQDSVSKPNPKRQSNHRYSPSTNHTPKRTDVRTNHPTSATRPLQQSQIKVPEEFKYCINCEKSILVKNIEYHERYECRELESIYKMSFHELRDFVDAKIKRMRKQVQESVVQLRQMQKARSSEFPQVDLKDQLCENVVKSIENYLKSTASMEQPISDNHLQEEYLIFQQNLKSQFFQCINLTHRLDYFIKVYFKINDQLALPLSLSHQHSCEYILKSTPAVRIETHAHQKTSSDRLADEGYRLTVKPVSDFQHGQ